MFKNEEGAIDLASIMVGIIVIGLIGGVIASTVFVVIPWAQDNAAKQQLDSVVSAENAYFGMSAATPSPLPTGSPANSFGKSAELAAANLLQTGSRYCVATPTDSKSYDAYSQSSSGAIFNVTDKNSKPVIFTGTLPTDCQFIADGAASATPAPPAPYVDPTPIRTQLTYKCDSAVASGAPPLYSGITGTETWSDTPGTPRTYTTSSLLTARSFAAGVTYVFTFDGTYDQFRRDASTAAQNLSPCLRSVDHWGLSTKVTSATMAFAQATNLTSVPDHIPTTLADMGYMFWGATKFNDPNVSNWDVSNVANMGDMFEATSFNQPLNSWNTSKVTNMGYMFNGNTKFNQALDNWDTSNVNAMKYMFQGATSFNQPLNTWKTPKLLFAQYMFNGATSFNYPLNTWNVSLVRDMSYMFQNDAVFNQDLSKWNTASVTSGSYFAPNTFNSAYLPPKTSKAP